MKTLVSFWIEHTDLKHIDAITDNRSKWLREAAEQRLDREVLDHWRTRK